LLAQRSKIFLAALQGCGFRAYRALEIHPEPQRPDEEAGHACGNILRDLLAFLGG
jgi:hypothetical protein